MSLLTLGVLLSLPSGEMTWCCASGVEIIVELEFNNGAPSEYLIFRGPRPCVPPGVHVRANFHDELRASAHLI